MGSAAADLLGRESRLLVQRLRLWTPTRWAASAPPWGTRGDLVHHLAQALSDEAAVLEGQPRRQLPRLGIDLSLPDQLAVVADDLARAGPASYDGVLHLLAHRADLLADGVPAALARELGTDDAIAAGRRVCAGREAPAT